MGAALCQAPAALHTHSPCTQGALGADHTAVTIVCLADRQTVQLYKQLSCSVKNNTSTPD